MRAISPDDITDDAVEPLLSRGRIHWRVNAYGTVGSTNEVARRLLIGGAPEGTLVVAQTQTSGRGRRGKRWHSPRGGLWFSLVLRPHLPPGRAQGLSVVAAIAVARALRNVAYVEARIKWPNDVYLARRKIAGVMVEAVGEGLVLGIGVNVNVPSEELFRSEWYEACSVLSETGTRYPLAEMLAAVVGEFEPRYFRFRSARHGELLEEWRELSISFGEHVAVTIGDLRLEGTVYGLADDGSLILRLHDGRQEEIAPLGDVTLMLGA